jgi:hypothetical protein
MPMMIGREILDEEPAEEEPVGPGKGGDGVFVVVREPVVVTVAKGVVGVGVVAVVVAVVVVVAAVVVAVVVVAAVVVAVVVEVAAVVDVVVVDVVGHTGAVETDTLVLELKP